MQRNPIIYERISRECYIQFQEKEPKLMKVIRKRLRRISPRLYKKMYSLNHRRGGTMQDTLRYERGDNPKKNAIVHYILDERKLIGWSLLFHDNDNKNKSHCQFYVRKDERRKGYGRQLFIANKKYTRRLNKYFSVVSDKSNRKFFKEARKSCID